MSKRYRWLMFSVLALIATLLGIGVGLGGLVYAQADTEGLEALELGLLAITATYQTAVYGIVDAMTNTQVNIISLVRAIINYP